MPAPSREVHVTAARRLLGDSEPVFLEHRVVRPCPEEVRDGEYLRRGRRRDEDAAAVRAALAARDIGRWPARQPCSPARGSRPAPRKSALAVPLRGAGPMISSMKDISAATSMGSRVGLRPSLRRRANARRTSFCRLRRAVPCHAVPSSLRRACRVRGDRSEVPGLEGRIEVRCWSFAASAGLLRDEQVHLRAAGVERGRSRLGCW